jgi:hypothetical protein
MRFFRQKWLKKRMDNAYSALKTVFLVCFEPQIRICKSLEQEILALRRDAATSRSIFAFAHHSAP